MLLATWMQKLISATQRYDGVQWWGEPIKHNIAILDMQKNPLQWDRRCCANRAIQAPALAAVQ